jgi:hypothetical protein
MGPDSSENGWDGGTPPGGYSTSLTNMQSSFVLLPGKIAEVLTTNGAVVSVDRFVNLEDCGMGDVVLGYSTRDELSDSGLGLQLILSVIGVFQTFSTSQMSLH